MVRIFDTHPQFRYEQMFRGVSSPEIIILGFISEEDIYKGADPYRDLLFLGFPCSIYFLNKTAIVITMSWTGPKLHQHSESL